MRKIYLLLLTALLFCVNIFAGDNTPVAGKKEAHLFDLVGPTISYTPLIKSSCLTNRSFSATITDVDGVNTAPGTRPRVYYRRTIDANAWISNATADNGWKYTEATNTSSPFNFVIDYTRLWFNGLVTPGHTIEYFVVAQDLATIPNISISSGSFAIAPVSVALTVAAFPMGGIINNYNIVSNIGTYIRIGAFEDYATLTANGGLFNVINNVGLSGNTIVEIVDPLITETNSHPLNQVEYTGCSAGPYTLLIKPAPGVTSTLTGNPNFNPIIRILSNNVTIDGSNNGTTSRNLTLSNTNVNSAGVIVYGSTGITPITNSTLKNTICVNASISTGSIIVADGAGAATPGYFNNITIQNNSLQKGGIGILCAALAGSGNGSVLVTGNEVNAGPPNQAGRIGIYAEGVDGATISNNSIGNFESTLTTPRYGIWLTGGISNTTISGNNISGINYTGSSNPVTYGILAAPAVPASNINITGNNISAISSTATNTVSGIGVTLASGGISIQKNNISNIKNINATGYGAYGISLASTSTTANITVANNFIYDIAGAGSAATPAVRNGHGIYLGSGGGYKIYNNSVALTTNQTNTSIGSVSAALMINGVSAANSLDIRNNIFANLQSGGVPVATRYAIFSANNNTIFSNIDYNDYYTTGTNLGFLSSARANLAAWQTATGKDASSLQVIPNFFSNTNLHLTTANCSLDGAATPIAAITTDYDNQARDAVTPDIGADEFTVTYNSTLAGIVDASICQSKTVSPAGTTYITGACDIIARVVPSGFDPVAGKINVCVVRDAVQKYFNGDPYVQRHYDIEPATGNQTSTSATVTLYFTNDEFELYNTTNPARPPLPTVFNGGNSSPYLGNVKITQFHGAATVSPSNAGDYLGTRVLFTAPALNVSWNGNAWEVTLNITGFSGFYLHSNKFEGGLPITINYFTGSKQGNNHLLNWKVTCNSSPRATMILERSSDSHNFSTVINSITADAVRCQQPFSYTDTDPLKGMNYYRLKVIDADGKVSYSSIVALLNAVKGFDIVSIAPNPVTNGNFKLNVTSAQNSKMELLIFDMQGRVMNRQTISVAAGFSSIPMQVGNLAAGTYTLYGIVDGDRSKVMRFVKQ